MFKHFLCNDASMKSFIQNANMNKSNWFPIFLTPLYNAKAEKIFEMPPNSLAHFTPTIYFYTI